MLPAAYLFGCRSFALGEGGNLCPVSAYVHAAPDPRALLAHVVKMQDTVIALSNARPGSGRQQIGKGICKRRECMLRNLRREVPTPLKMETAWLT
jgi:hypothetical protein